MIKILIIAYYFPPCSAIGSKRWSKMFNQLGLTEEIDAKILTANWNGNKKQKKDMIKDLKMKIHDYPKGDNKNYKSIDIKMKLQPNLLSLKQSND